MQRSNEVPRRGNIGSRANKHLNKYTVLDEELSIVRKQASKRDVFELTEPYIIDLPAVARPLGVETTVLIDSLLDKNKTYFNDALSQIRLRKVSKTHSY
jgi:hypothetical protein